MERLDWIGKGRERTGRDRREEDEEAMIPMAEDFFRAQGQKVWLDACEWAFGAFCLDFWAAIRRGLIAISACRSYHQCDFHGWTMAVEKKNNMATG